MKQNLVPRSPRLAQRARLSFAAAGTLAIITLGGCGTFGGGGSGGAGRPSVNATAAESASTTKSIRGLSFFDELETRSLVAHDDALEGVLLLACGRGASSYGERLSAAKSLGLIDSGFDRPAREASTIGEVAQMVARVLDREGGSGASQEKAVGELVSRGMLPPPARVVQGLTGAQLVSILGAAEDQMRQSGIARMSFPTSGRRDARALEALAAGGPEPLPNLPLEGETSKGPTAQATASREAATRAQVERQIQAATLRETGGKKPVWIPGQSPAGTENASAPTDTPGK
jgi:hypothetical protein